MNHPLTDDPAVLYTAVTIQALEILFAVVTFFTLSRAEWQQRKSPIITSLVVFATPKVMIGGFLLSRVMGSQLGRYEVGLFYMLANVLFFFVSAFALLAPPYTPKHWALFAAQLLVVLNTMFSSVLFFVL